MPLLPATQAHLPEIMSWFADADSVRIWGGWQFRFPFTPESFAADVQLAERPSYVLKDAGAVQGFGQVYLRVGRCHFGRLAVAPDARGQGLGTRLLLALTEEGQRELDVPEYSLFVSRQNVQAEKLYRRLGFVHADYPEAGVPEDYAYMVARSLGGGQAV
jgi:ribosomal protein S18 acetylase RimI-like enzyme